MGLVSFTEAEAAVSVAVASVAREGLGEWGLSSRAFSLLLSFITLANMTLRCFS